MKKTIMVIIKEPGKPATVEPCFENTLESFQKAVGGHIECVTFCDDCTIVCNEEGRLMDLPKNCKCLGVDFVGTIIIAGVKGEEFCSLKSAQIPFLLKIFVGKKND